MDKKTVTESAEAPTESDEIPVESAEAPTESDEIPVQSAESDISSKLSKEELLALVSEQNAKLENYEDKLKRSLADYANLQKKTASDIESGVNNQIDRCFLDFLQIYDDFLRAKEAFASSNVKTDGLDSILKNMESFLAKYNVTAIDALGEIFDPNLHEAISITPDSQLDDGTITKELRKGYISHNRVIRPTLVEISKRGT